MSERKHYLFDIDGTLTPPRGKMSAGFLMKFLDWMSDKSVFLVAGSDKKKVDEQVPHSIIKRCSGIFCSMANEFWMDDELIYKKEWEPSIDLVTKLTDVYVQSPYLNKKDAWLEMRTGMANFSVAGRDSNYDERLKYFEWDKQSGERIYIVDYLSEMFPDLDFRIGGQISIDICPKGFNKSLASKWIRKNLGGAMLFFGDSCHEGGNDYDIYLDIENNEEGKAYNVESPKETLRMLGVPWRC